MKRGIIFSFSIISVVLLVFVVSMTITRGISDNRLLGNSVKSQITTTCLDAISHIDAETLNNYAEGGMDAFDNPIDDELYIEQLDKLTTLKNNAGGATRIYVLIKKSDNTYSVLLDTGATGRALSILENLNEVQRAAFNGETKAETLIKTDDSNAAYNSCAAPIFKESGSIAGILCVDVVDEVISKSITNLYVNIAFVILIPIFIIAFAGSILLRLMTRIGNMQNELRRLANYDKLTELPNRRYLFDHLDNLLSDLRKTPFALYFIDLDNFKKVNDNAGHDAGDDFLVKIGAYFDSFQNGSRVFSPEAGNVSLAARVGGDEFIIIVQNIETEEQASDFAKEILNGFSGTEFDKYIEKYSVGLSIGVSLFPQHSDNCHVLIKYADTAMYKAKNSGKNCFRIYRENMKLDDGSANERVEAL